MKIWLRSLVFNLAFYSWTVFLSFLMAPALLISRHAVLLVAHSWLRQMEWIECHIGGITWRVVGREFVPEGSVIIASKHQSAWETFKLHLLFYDPVVVLKKSLIYVPLWGWYLARSGVVAIDRTKGHKALVSMMTAAHKVVDQGRKIVIFPQGTRLAPGTWRPYKSGIGLLYEELKIPVVPMALNSGVLWPKNSFLKKPGVITVEFLPPIPPGLPRAEMMKRLEEGLEKATTRLVKEAGG